MSGRVPSLRDETGAVSWHGNYWLCVLLPQCAHMSWDGWATEVIERPITSDVCVCTVYLRVPEEREGT